MKRKHVYQSITNDINMSIKLCDLNLLNIAYEKYRYLKTKSDKTCYDCISECNPNIYKMLLDRELYSHIIFIVEHGYLSTQPTNVAMQMIASFIATDKISNDLVLNMFEFIDIRHFTSILDHELQQNIITNSIISHRSLMLSRSIRCGLNILSIPVNKLRILLSPYRSEYDFILELIILQIPQNNPKYTSLYKHIQWWYNEHFTRRASTFIINRITNYTTDPPSSIIELHKQNRQHSCNIFDKYNEIEHNNNTVCTIVSYPDTCPIVPSKYALTYDTCNMFYNNCFSCNADIIQCIINYIPACVRELYTIIPYVHRLWAYAVFNRHSIDMTNIPSVYYDNGIYIYLHSCMIWSDVSKYYRLTKLILPNVCLYSLTRTVGYLATVCTNVNTLSITFASLDCHVLDFNSCILSVMGKILLFPNLECLNLEYNRPMLENIKEDFNLDKYNKWKKNQPLCNITQLNIELDLYISIDDELMDINMLVDDTQSVFVQLHSIFYGKLTSFEYTINKRVATSVYSINYLRQCNGDLLYLNLHAYLGDAYHLLQKCKTAIKNIVWINLTSIPDLTDCISFVKQNCPNLKYIIY